MQGPIWGAVATPRKMQSNATFIDITTLQGYTGAGILYPLHRGGGYLIPLSLAI